MNRSAIARGVHGRDVIRVVVADGHAIVRVGIRMLLGSLPEISIVGEADDGLDAVALIERLAPAVAVLDSELPRLSGVEVARELADRQLVSRVLILAMENDARLRATSLQAGAAGVLSKGSADSELADAIRTIAAGQHYVCSGAPTARWIGRRSFQLAAQREWYAHLTPRERSVLVLTADGWSSQEIGARLLVSPKVVDSYKERLGESIGLSHQAAYLQLCVRLGLLRPA